MVSKMKSITIHNLDDKLSDLIQEKAKKQGLSLNKTVKLLLMKSLGIKEDNEYNHREDFLDLYGKWTKEEEKSFLKRINELNTIQEQDWE